MNAKENLPDKAVIVCNCAQVQAGLYCERPFRLEEKCPINYWQIMDCWDKMLRNKSGYAENRRINRLIVFTHRENQDDPV